MKYLVIALGLGLAACKSSKPHGGRATAPPTPSAANLPRLDNAAATLLPATGAPQLVVFVDASGSIRVAAGPASWAGLDGASLDAKAVPTDSEMLHRMRLERRTTGATGAEVIQRIMMADKPVPAQPPREEPPPPPEPPEPDTESGGMGAAMALDEGKMGRADSRYSNIGMDEAELRRGDCPNTRIDRERSPDDSSNTRACDEMADVLRDGRISDDPDGYPFSVLFAAPTAKVAPLLPLSSLAGLVAVSVGGKVRLLRLAFDNRALFAQRPVWEQKWIEVRISGSGLDVRGPEGATAPVSWSAGPLDAAALGKAYTSVLATTELDTLSPVDVLVAPDTDVQHLVEVFAALDVAGATIIGVGEIPKDAPQRAPGGGYEVGVRPMGSRPAGTPLTTLGTPTIEGNLAVKVVQRLLRRDMQKFQYCYERVMLVQNKPNLAGTVTAEFLIGSNGSVSDVHATGVDGEVAACVGGILRDIEYPKPAGGGTAQVSTTFTFAPTGG